MSTRSIATTSGRLVAAAAGGARRGDWRHLLDRARRHIGSTGRADRDHTLHLHGRRIGFDWSAIGALPQEHLKGARRQRTVELDLRT